MLSSTTALMAGEETALHNMYPYEINVQTSSKESLNSFSNDVQELIEGEGHKVEKKDTVCCLSVAAVCRGESFEVTKPGNFGDLNSLNNLVFLSLDEYNRLMGEGKTGTSIYSMRPVKEFLLNFYALQILQPHFFEWHLYQLVPRGFPLG